MRIDRWFAILCALAIPVLLLASCAPAAAPTPTPAPSKPAATPPAEATEAKLAGSPTAPSPSPKPAATQPRSGGILNMGHWGDPPSYDPIQESSLIAIAPVIPSYSGIVQHDPLEPARVIGDLAEKWDMSPDGLTYTFSLYKNVKFHDGSPFTSEDARFSLEIVRNPPKGVNSPRREWLKAVDKIEAVDRDTLKITLSYPSGSFLHNLGDGRMVIVPKHIFEAKGNMKRDVVGTGPFKLKAHLAGATYNIVRNPDYFIKGRPYLEGITFYIMVDSATRFAALRTHRIQMPPFGTPGLTPSQTEILRRDMVDKISVYRYPSFIFHAFYMPNTRPPWNDVRVRRAVELTIDRPKVIKVATEGAADIGAYMPPGEWSLPTEELMKIPGYRPDKEADIAEAKRLMAEAGYSHGIKTTTLIRTLNPLERSATSLKEQLAQIGIDMTISSKDAGTAYDLLFKRSFDTGVQSGSASFDDPDQVFGQQFITGVPYNYDEFSDDKIDKWYDEQARSLDPAKRKQIVLDMQRRMFELVPISMLYWMVYEIGNWTEVRDFKPGLGVYNNLKFQNVWLAAN